MKWVQCLLLASGLTLGGVVQLPDFSGTWTLDRLMSNDPTQVNFEAPPPQAPGATNPHRGGFSASGFGMRAGSGGGGGSNSRSQSEASAITPDERARLTALTNQLKGASATLTIAHQDPKVAITDALGRTLTFETDASRDNHTFGAVTFTSTSHWEGDRIIVEAAISDRRTLVYTFTLLPNTHQMVLRVRPQFSDLPQVNGSELKLVYSLKK
jgi:hypothetical protein